MNNKADAKQTSHAMLVAVGVGVLGSSPQTAGSIMVGKGIIGPHRQEVHEKSRKVETEPRPSGSGTVTAHRATRIDTSGGRRGLFTLRNVSVVPLPDGPRVLTEAVKPSSTDQYA